MKDLLTFIDNFNKQRDWDQFHTPNNLAKSIVIEANELLEHYQFNADGDDLNGIKEELADVLSYCFMLAQKLDLDPIEIVYDKYESNARKYPADLVRGSSKKYNEYKNSDR